MPSHEMMGKTRATGSIDEASDGQHLPDKRSQTGYGCVRKKQQRQTKKEEKRIAQIRMMSHNKV